MGLTTRLIPPTEGHPCGHSDRTSGCGGCDPGAVEFVRDDGGSWTRILAPAELVEPNTELGRNSGSVLPPEESTPEMLARVAAEEEAHADDTDRPHYRNRVTPPAVGGTDE